MDQSSSTLHVYMINCHICSYNRARRSPRFFTPKSRSTVGLTVKKKTRSGERRPLIFILRSLCRDSNPGWLSKLLLWHIRLQLGWPVAPWEYWHWVVCSNVLHRQTVKLSLNKLLQVTMLDSHHVKRPQNETQGTLGATNQLLLPARNTWAPPWQYLIRRSRDKYNGQFSIHSILQTCTSN